MTRALIVLAVLVVTTAAVPQPSPVYKLEELSWPQIAAFEAKLAAWLAERRKGS